MVLKYLKNHILSLAILLDLLTIPITLREIYFFLPIFAFFAKNGKNKKFPGLSVNRLEIKQRALLISYMF